jgi:hypothetical protein
MGRESFPYPKAMLTITACRFGANAVALRLSDNPYLADHGFHPWLSNATAPQLRQLRWHNGSHLTQVQPQALVAATVFAWEGNLNAASASGSVVCIIQLQSKFDFELQRRFHSLANAAQVRACCKSCSDGSRKRSKSDVG